MPTPIPRYTYLIIMHTSDGKFYEVTDSESDPQKFLADVEVSLKDAMFYKTAFRALVIDVTSVEPIGAWQTSYSPAEVKCLDVWAPLVRRMI